MSTSDRDKIRILLPHWMEHNHSHGLEFQKWVAVARQEGMEEVAGLIEQAMARSEEMNALLAEALEQAGGALADHSHHH